MSDGTITTFDRYVGNKTVSGVIEKIILTYGIKGTDKNKDIRVNSLEIKEISVA
ncbi:hypothetical protein [Enterococcus sp. OL5]|uniref:hypothetical protein n=1 Tax=Enterococcus sp. OL5 TaxID=2590214 RepID=UPI00167268B8|nr:hypothetical protein [Enterococcus sp. OL5]